MISFLLALSLISSFQTDLRRVHSHLKVGDAPASLVEAKKIMAGYPDSVNSYEVMLKALCYGGDPIEMMRFWDQFHERFPKEAEASAVLEEISWAILRKGREANTLSSRLISTIGAALTQDAYAIDFLLAGLQDSNAHIRSISIQLSSLYRDEPLRKEIVKLFHTERSLEVRLSVIKAIGELKESSLYPNLLKIIEDKKSCAEEKAVATEAIVALSEKIDRDQLAKLTQDKRSGLRLLACECIAQFTLVEQADLLFQLIHDANPEVASAALRAIGLLHIDSFQGHPVADHVRALTRALDPYVGATASWVLLLYEKEAGELAFSRWIFHEKEEVRAFAASAIAASGSYGIDAALTFLEKSQDPYVRVNLAFALIGQRVKCDLACEILNTLLMEHQDLWMQGEGVFRPLLRSTLAHKPAIANFPEVVNQTVRLEMINLLAILDYPGAEEAIRNFLKERRYGVTGLAAELLLGEGDEKALDHIKDLLNDPDREIRLDAALVLATWGRDPAALPVLLQVYPEADRMLKIKILESLGRIGDHRAIPFLIERLKEPSLNLRMIAASVLIQTLHH